jgi:hypothetical protein
MRPFNYLPVQQMSHLTKSEFDWSFFTSLTTQRFKDHHLIGQINPRLLK